MPAFLQDRIKLLFFSGKGGVGKTTCATATALQLARIAPEVSFLLISTDPAHSVIDCLAGLTPPANLATRELNAPRELAAFQSKHRQKFREIALKGTYLDESDLGRFLDLSLPGLDEIMALLFISRTVAARRYDTVVVDTAPTGHTLRLLALPELLGRWLRALDGLLAKHRFMKERFNGSGQGDELDDFLADLGKAWQGLQALLRDPARCRFVPVLLAEELVIRETASLLIELKRLGVPVGALVINRLYPASTCPVCAGERRRQEGVIAALAADPIFRGHELWAVPQDRREVRGKALLRFWEGASRLKSAGGTASSKRGPILPRVEAPPAYPAPGQKFLIFAGKGGVGKTTLACASAVRLAQDLQGQNILLVSTDPAHSLSDCLQVSLKSGPSRVRPGLMALEIDAAREFEALKTELRQGLAGFLESAGGRLDLPFERRATEQLLELSPPGLDEIMALVRTLDFLEQGPFGLIILDSAPTGHLLRLLELPEVLDQWLKGLFGILLKYRLAKRLPEFSQRLVRISRGLKLLQELWRDPARTAVYGVAGLTEMAFKETEDLVMACQRLGMQVPVLLLNLATPAASRCSLCTSLVRREARVRARFQRKFKNQHLSLVYRQEDPRGLERLAELGRSLYPRPWRRAQRGGKSAGLPVPYGRPDVQTSG